MEKWVRANYQPVLPLGENGTRITACEKHISLSKEAAKEGMVLLKNEGNVLPLENGAKVALFGKATFDYVKGGSGSGNVTVSYISNLYDGLKKESVCIYEELSDFYRSYVEKEYEKGIAVGMVGEPALPKELLMEARDHAEVAIISLCRFQGESYDGKWKRDTQFVNITPRARKLCDMAEKIYDRGDYYLTAAEEAMIHAVKEVFDKVVVVLNIGNLIDSSWFAEDEQIQAVLLGWQGGMEGGTAEAELLAGKSNPCGKLADTLVKDLSAYPSTEGFHESEEYVNYIEDIYVGYRYFHTIPNAEKQITYPFGFGLSYTEFKISNVTAEKKDEKIVVSADVTNVGEKPGKEVIQVYYSAPQGKLGKPAKELAAFQKTKLLAPGEAQSIRLELTINDMASFDDLGKIQKSAFVLEKGIYSFYVGNSVCHTKKCDYQLELLEDMIVEQLSSQLAPCELKERMLSDGKMEQLPACNYEEEPNVLVPINRPETQRVVPAVKARARYSTLGLEEHRHKLIEVAEEKLTLEEFIDQLTDEELADLLGGQPNTGVANCNGFGNIPEYGVPNIMTTDGPAGVRINKNCGVCTTAWPCATLLACTWNMELVEEIGKAGSLEVKENNLGIWLTPGVNIHRNPLCGRNFEYYSEDPYLSGKMAVAMVRGIQSNHIAATVKHFALNNKEVNRKVSDSRVSERAIREIYLSAFKMVIQEADPWLFMSSYNVINGRRVSESRELLENILRKEWGYKGCVTTDWWTYGEHYKEAKGGSDVKMGSGYPERLLEAVKLGALSRKDMEKCAKRILQLILKID